MCIVLRTKERLCGVVAWVCWTSNSRERVFGRTAGGIPVSVRFSQVRRHKYGTMKDLPVTNARTSSIAIFEGHPQLSISSAVGGSLYVRKSSLQKNQYLYGPLPGGL